MACLATKSGVVEVKEEDAHKLHVKEAGCFECSITSVRKARHHGVDEPYMYVEGAGSCTCTHHQPASCQPPADELRGRPEA